MFNKLSKFVSTTKKILISGLAIGLFFGSISSIHAAGNHNIRVLGEDVGNAMFYKISDNSLSSQGATQGDYNLYFDPSMNSLYLKDFVYEGSGNVSENGDISLIDISSDENINIICEGNNSISLSSAGNKEGQLIAAIISHNAGINIETNEESSLTINVNGQNYVEYSQNSEKDMICAVYANNESADLYINGDININVTDVDPEKGATLCGLNAKSLKLDKSANISLNCSEAFESYGVLTAANTEIYGAKAIINVAESIANDKRSNGIKAGGSLTVGERTYLDVKSYDNAIVAGSILINDFDLINVETLGSESKAFEISDRENGSFEVKIDRNLSNFETEYSAGAYEAMKKINSINAKTFENPCVSLKIYTKINLVDFAMPMIGESLDTDVNCKSDFIEDTNVYCYECIRAAEGEEKSLIEYPEKTNAEAGKIYEFVFEFTPDENYTPSRNYILSLIDGFESESYVENGKIYAVFSTDELLESSIKSNVEKWEIGEDKGSVCFELSGAYTKDVLLTVDNKPVDEELYKYNGGKVYVSEELFNKLLKGKHEIRASFFEAGKLISSADSSIDIHRDVNGSYFWRIIAIGAVVLAVVLVSMFIKKKNK